MKQEQFITRKPADPHLHPYISYYYFHSSPDSRLRKKFIYYPNFKSALTIYQHSRVSFGPNYSSVEPATDTDFIFLYSGMQTQLRVASMTAPFNKVGVVFRPLGINHFIKEPLAEISDHPIEKSFDYFGKDLKRSCNAIYREEDMERKVALLDHFFSAKFQGLPENTLKHCVHTILQTTEKVSVRDLSETCRLSRRTLLRLFQKHLCCSVKEYINIVQFRKALNDYFLKEDTGSLTRIALENGYYDQPQFINHFKKLAGLNPSLFFKKVEHIGNEDTFWNFQ